MAAILIFGVSRERQTYHLIHGSLSWDFNPGREWLITMRCDLMEKKPQQSVNESFEPEQQAVALVRCEEYREGEGIQLSLPSHRAAGRHRRRSSSRGCECW